MTAETSLDAALERLDARIDWERRDRSSGWRVDLDPIHDLVVRTGRPDRAFEIVHVAGSKGKGSVASLVGAGLRRAGCSVGIYGSPHVERIHERIAIGGSPIGDAVLARALTEALDAVEAAEREATAGADASWFDVVTLAGLCAFRDAGVDWAVLEVGLGGRLDSTNVIDPPAVAVVTTIELEHTAILGDTHAKIAAEKAGIAKTGAPLVTGCDPSSEAGRTLAAVARERGVRHVVAWSADDVTFEQENVRVARAALDVLGETREGVDASLLNDATIAAARLPGRMETRELDGVRVVLDGAHVPESLERALAETTRGRSGPLAIVLAVHREKDLEALLAPIAGMTATRLFATTVPGSGVHAAETEVEAAASRLGIAVEVHADPGAALRAAVDRSGRDGGAVLATGSLYLVGALRPLVMGPK